MNTAQYNTVKKMLEALHEHTMNHAPLSTLPAELQQVFATLQGLKDVEYNRATVTLDIFKASRWYCEESVIKSVCPWEDVPHKGWITGYTPMACDDLNITVNIHWAAITDDQCFESVGLAHDIDSGKMFDYGDNEIVGDDGEELGDHYIYNELQRLFTDWKTGAIEAVNAKLSEIKELE